MTPSKEDYLKKIVELGGETQIISNKELVQAMNVSAASVTEMNARLLKDNFITYIPYKGVKVTKRGLQLANQLIRKHRIWELFLVQQLGFDWEEVHEEAEQLEHISSDKLINRLDEILGHPKYDPHGGIIPRSDGTFPKTSYVTLSELDVDTYFIVREVSDQPEYLAYISHKKIQLGKTYYLKEIDELNAIYILMHQAEKDDILINQHSAEQLHVEVIAK